MSIYIVVQNESGPPSSSAIEQHDVGVIEDDNEFNDDASKECQIFLLRLEKSKRIPKNNFQKIDLNETGDGSLYKICDRCFKYLETEPNFSNNRHKKDGITKRPSCKKCRREKDGEPVSAEDRRRSDAIKPKFGERFECPICKKTTIAGITKHVLDHDHSNGKIRGFLCEACNTGIGRFDDDIEKLEDAIKWLKSGGDFEEQYEQLEEKHPPA